MRAHLTRKIKQIQADVVKIIGQLYRYRKLQSFFTTRQDTEQWGNQMASKQFISKHLSMGGRNHAGHLGPAITLGSQNTKLPSAYNCFSIGIHQ